ncbi:hypothetical protein F5Y15DRAFT_273857 [Xylariaceae sp. FL0016]|nr:hypothetical protein F5Y15DRAFT_273857 [Xylariaceae sp. FL0016]
MPLTIKASLRSSEWPAHAENYLLEGGTVETVIETLFESIKDAAWTRDEDSSEWFHDDIQKFSECRNDCEYDFVYGMCGYALQQPRGYDSPLDQEESDPGSIDSD